MVPFMSAHLYAFKYFRACMCGLADENVNGI